MAEAGQLLNEGEIVQYNGHLFRVEKAAKRRILQVRMERSEPAEDTEEP